MTREPRVLNGEKTVSSINGSGITGHSDVKEWKQTHSLYHSQKWTENGLKTFKSKAWIHETLRRKHRNKTLLDTSLGNDFLDMTSKGQAIK